MKNNALRLMTLIAFLSIGLSITPALAIDEGVVMTKPTEAQKKQKTDGKQQKEIQSIERKHGSDSLRAAVALNDLGERYVEQGRESEALPLFQRALAIREKRLGPDDPSIADNLEQLARIHALTTSGLIEAEPLYKRALMIRKKSLGLVDLSVADTMIALGDLYSRIQHILNNGSDSWKLILALSAQSADLRSEKYNKMTEQERSDALAQLDVKISDKTGELKKIDVAYYYFEALTIRLEKLGDRHYSLLSLLKKLAPIYEKQGLQNNLNTTNKSIINIYEHEIKRLHACNNQTSSPP